MLDNIDTYLDDLRRYEPAKVLEYFVNMLMTSLFSIKNPGFNEEREWRFVYHESASSHLHHDIVVVDGIPQVIYKLPLSSPSAPQTGVPLEEALEEIIIGPSQYAEVIELAFVRMLDELGISNAAERVSKSNIPLR